MIEKQYIQKNVPIFQNKVYADFEEAISVQSADVVLGIDKEDGIMVNLNFNPELMHYDSNYQNEQGHSPYFQEYILEVFRKFTSKIENKNAKIAEIGCGKGYFLELLNSNGYNISGFDPTYEGSNPLVIKEYFDERFTNLGVDIFLLRHTMEHIPNPFSFLHTIAKANEYKGKIFIEVPTLDWIIEKKSFWDIFYEHCNYFTEATFANFFKEAETGRLFNDQYMYLYADLSQLKKKVDCFVVEEKDFHVDFNSLLVKWEKIIRENSDNGIAIWGAGGKGSTFLNILDGNRKLIKCVVDINPKKQNRFVARTGHKIISPEEFLKITDVKTIIIMNENYKKEIIDFVNNDSVNYLVL